MTLEPEFETLVGEDQEKRKGKIDAKNGKLENVKIQLAEMPEAPKALNNNSFLKGLLRMQGETSFSRLQIVAWTLILAMVFLHSVFADLLMPPFDATLLGLMGISGGTYIRFKFSNPPVVAS